MKKIPLIIFCALAFVKSQAQYTTSNFINNLNQGIAFVITPDNRYLVTEKAGDIKIFNSSGTLLGTFWNNIANTESNFEQGLLGICLDPDYTNNHWVYVYYCHLNPKSFRVVRLTDVSNVGTSDSIILNIPHGTIAGNHVGGNIRFRPSTPTKLYITIGENAVPSNSQLLTNPMGKILRINKNGTIPTDNPFYDDGNPATGNDDRIWEYGHRNAFDFTFSPVNDSLYITENGQNAFDELNLGVKGHNYGWQICEGNFHFGSTTSPCNDVGLTNPINTWAAPVPSVTGVLHVTSALFPELQNHLLVADNNNGKVYNVTLGNPPAYNTVTNVVQWLDLVSGSGLTTLMQGNDGAIYALNGGYANPGKIIRVVPNALTAISTSPLGFSSMCAGFSFNVSFTVTGTANINNQFVAQLSSQNGSFASPTVIGTVSGVTGGTILCTTSTLTQQGTHYRIRVVSTDPVVTGSNNGSNLTITAYCPKSTAVTAGNITSTSALVAWNAAACNATNYKFRYKASTAANWTTVNVNGTSYQMSGLTPSTNYSYKVRTNCGTQHSGYTQAQNFNTTARMGENIFVDATADPVMNVFPNPAADQLNIQVTNLADDASGKISITNLLGQVLFQQQAAFTIGDNLNQVSLKDFPSGIYTVCLSLNGKEVKQQLVVTK